MRKKILLSECEPGQILADDVLNDSGLLVIPKNATINEFVIDKLSFYGIESVTVFEHYVENGDEKRAPYNKSTKK